MADRLLRAEDEKIGNKTIPHDPHPGGMGAGFHRARITLVFTDLKKA